MKNFLLTYLLFASCAGALAQEVALSPEFDSCEKSAAEETFRLLDCQSEELARQDKRLNDAYRRLFGRLSATKNAELKSVQRAWVAYVNLKCKFYFDNADFSGQADRLGASYCEVTERARRVKELEQLENRYE